MQATLLFLVDNILPTHVAAQTPASQDLLPLSKDHDSEHWAGRRLQPKTRRLLAITPESHGREFTVAKPPTPYAHGSSLVMLQNGDTLVVWFGGESEGKPSTAIWRARRTAKGVWQPAYRMPKVRGCIGPLFLAVDPAWAGVYLIACDLGGYCGSTCNSSRNPRFVQRGFVELVRPATGRTRTFAALSHHERVPHPQVNYMAHWNPVVFWTRPEGKRKRVLWLHFKVGFIIDNWKTYAAKSTDDGVTWSKPQELVPGASNPRNAAQQFCIAKHAWSASSHPMAADGSIKDCSTFVHDGPSSQVIRAAAGV